MENTLNTINTIVFDDRIILYWDRPSRQFFRSLEDSLGLPYDRVESSYRIFLDGAEIGSTAKTHFTIEDLTPDTEYLLRIIHTVSGETEERGKAEGREETCDSVLLVRTSKPKKRIDVTKAPYHAVGDGQMMNTKALQQAFDDCDESSLVYIPEGIYMTGALRMHSDMELYLEENAVLQGTDRPEDYLPRILSRFEGTEMFCYSSLLNLGELDHSGGYSCENVVIRGKGTIASGGAELAKRIIRTERENLKDYLASLGDKIKECESKDTIPGRVRPRLINMSNCKNIRLSGLTFKNGASWNVHMIYSDSIVTNDCTFCSEGVWNGDGWDPDSSTNCTIFGCTFYTEDDSIAIKSGKNPEGNKINKPSAHIKIFDCRTAFGHGITIGSEMSGGVEDVRIWDCDMANTLSGIEIKGTKKRGGYVREVHVEKCTASRIMFHSVGYNDDGISAPTAPVFEKCSFEDVSILGEYYDNHKKERAHCDAIELVGFDKPGHEIRDILFRNVMLGKEGDGRKQSVSLQLCENVTLEKVRCR